ncbi:hypothetical protein MA16_Dca010451 [Dendrobium catenatum]|uniref:Uncharacterized protein n=1 Tax=Dendrobium catenatum TaxID=906689 RepID=A0A2I0XBK7_9ASPA|nr:hypothetical protein MA16_Dca010451 [Dendrobium catenatum]
MDLQSTPMIVQLGRGARIQLENAIIEIGNAGATIQFSSLNFSAVIERTAIIPVNDMESEGPAKRPHSIEAATRRAHLPAPQPTTEESRRRIKSSTRELKKSFWDYQPEVPIPPKKKEPEIVSAKVYIVLKMLKDKGLKKKKFQRPLVIEARRTLLRERLSVAMERRERKQVPPGVHRGVTPEPHV